MDIPRTQFIGNCLLFSVVYVLKFSGPIWSCDCENSVIEMPVICLDFAKATSGTLLNCYIQVTLSECVDFENIYNSQIFIL